MWLRQALYVWLFPAALILPLWLLVGWGVFRAGGWAFVWVIFLAIPSVLIGQLLFALLVRARPSARADRAVSWWDAAGFGLWHGLTIALGFYPEGWFAILFILAIVVGVGMIPLLLSQLWSEARGSLTAMVRRWDEPLTSGEPGPDSAGVYVVRESPPLTR